MSEPTIRRTRLEELLFEEVQSIVPLEMADPRVVDAQVTRLVLAADMKSCRVFVFLPGDAARRTEVVAALNHAAAFVRGRVAETLALKYSPRFLFCYDAEYERALRVQGLLDRLEGEPLPEPDQPGDPSRDG